MYKTVICLQEVISESLFCVLSDIITSAFSNRAGEIKNISVDKGIFVFEGEEKDYGCLQLGILSIRKNIQTKGCIAEWKWIDEEPDECCDVLQEISIPMH